MQIEVFSHHADAIRELLYPRRFQDITVRERKIWWFGRIMFDIDGPQHVLDAIWRDFLEWEKKRMIDDAW